MTCMKDRIASCTGASGHGRTFARQLNLEKKSLLPFETS